MLSTALFKKFMVLNKVSKSLESLETLERKSRSLETSKSRDFASPRSDQCNLDVNKCEAYNKKGEECAKKENISVVSKKT